MDNDNSPHLSSKGGKTGHFWLIFVHNDQKCTENGPFSPFWAKMRTMVIVHQANFCLELCPKLGYQWKSYSLDALLSPFHENSILGPKKSIFGVFLTILHDFWTINLTFWQRKLQFLIVFPCFPAFYGPIRFSQCINMFI